MPTAPTTCQCFFPLQDMAAEWNEIESGDEPETLDAAMLLIRRASRKGACHQDGVEAAMGTRRSAPADMAHWVVNAQTLLYAVYKKCIDKLPVHMEVVWDVPVHVVLLIL